MAKFLFDNDIPYRIADALNELDFEHEIHPVRDVFSADAKDADWIPKAAKGSYILISKDLNQTRRSAERLALRRAKLTAIYLNPFFSNRKFWEQAEFLVRHCPGLRGWALGVRRGTIGEVGSNGKVTERNL